MFRFLVVEDYEPTLKEIKALLSKEFSGSSTDTAGSVVEGSQCISASFEKGSFYDAVLLDFKLPSSIGENPELDYSLREEVRRKHPHTLLIHMTSYDMDPAILRHLAESYQELGSSQTLLVPKRCFEWPTILLNNLRKFLFSREISRQMDELFGPDISTPSYPGPLRHRTQRGGGATHRLAKLTQDIESYWKDLDRDLQRRIGSIFVVHATGEDVRVSLL